MGDVQNHPTAMAVTITPPPPSLPPSQRAEPPGTQFVIRQTRARSGMSGRLWRIVGRAFAERGSSPIMKRISGRTRMSSATQARGDITNQAWPSDALASPL
jgi:hypothetical protein